MLTKSQIIDETELAYMDPNNRAVVGDSCRYFFHGKMCAVGRCLIDPEKISKEINGTAYSLNNRIAGGLDEVLKEEYRGHSVEFWYSLQCFHDSGCNFTVDSISDLGKEYLSYLREMYPN